MQSELDFEGKMADAPKYRQPPIVEGVFEFRFSETLDVRDLERLRDKFKSQYPAIEERRNVDVNIQADNPALEI